jgi:hypothetical protein
VLSAASPKQWDATDYHFYQTKSYWLLQRSNQFTTQLSLSCGPWENPVCQPVVIHILLHSLLISCFWRFGGYCLALRWNVTVQVLRRVKISLRLRNYCMMVSQELLGICGFLLGTQGTSSFKPGGSPGSSPLRSDGSRDDQARGRLVRWSIAQRRPRVSN